jgi:hypothetical protein
MASSATSIRTMSDDGNAMTLMAGYDIVAINPSCPGSSRASTSAFGNEKDVDGRNKSGHDERG